MNEKKDIDVRYEGRTQQNAEFLKETYTKKLLEI